MRRRHSQFALVRDHDELLGLVTMQDLLDRLLPAPPLRRGQEQTAGISGPER
jgi:CBS domain containing-hemolysin-like protein